MHNPLPTLKSVSSTANLRNLGQFLRRSLHKINYTPPPLQQLMVITKRNLITTGIIYCTLAIYAEEALIVCHIICPHVFVRPLLLILIIELPLCKATSTLNGNNQSHRLQYIPVSKTEGHGRQLPVPKAGDQAVHLRTDASHQLVDAVVGHTLKVKLFLQTVYQYVKQSQR